MKLKKMFAVVAVLVLVCAMAITPVLAASGINENEQAVYDKIFASVQIGSASVSLLEGRQAEVTNYFNMDGIDMTAEQKDQIIALIDNAIAAVQSNKEAVAWAEAGNTSLSKLPSDVKETLLNDASAACAVMNLTFNYDSASNSVTITDAQGNVLSQSNAVVKQTGAVDTTALVVAAIALVAALAAAVVIVLRKRVAA